MRSWILLFALLCGLTPAFAHAEDSKAGESDPHGAVLCVWSIFVELKNYGTVCSFDSASSTQKLLDESIGRMDKFITDNSEITQSQLDDKKSAILKHNQDDAEEAGPEALAKSCAADSANSMATSYQKLAANPQITRDRITKLLATPRKPVMNPCM